MEKKYSRKHIGEVFTTKESLGSYELTIIDGGTKPGHCIIQINDWIKEVQYGDVKRGQVKYPYHPSVFDVGYIGEGDAIASINRKNTKVYSTWKGILERAYYSKCHLKHPTYKDVGVCDEWLNFNVFAKWFEKNYTDGYDLDKDLLSTDNKIYSPNTCVFIPRALNSFLANIKSDNTSGFTGVSWNKDSNNWIVSINHPKTNKVINLGRFKDIKKASKVYQNKRRVYVRYWRYIAKKVYNLPEQVVKNIK